MKTISLWAAIGSVLFAAGATAAQETSPSAKAPCFFITQWRGWKSPDPSTLYLGISNRNVYEVKLSSPFTQLSSPTMHLVFKSRGTGSVCSALDLNLRISDSRGFSTPLIAKSLRKLSPEEVAAIPNKYRPS